MPPETPQPQPSGHDAGPAARAPVAALAPTVFVAARNEADRIGATLASLAEAFPGAELIVADDASTDATAEVAAATGALVVSGRRSLGKGGNMTRAVAWQVERLTALGAPPTLLCDGDLGDSAAELRALVDAVADGTCDLAIAAFRRRIGGGVGAALRYASWSIRRRSGYEAGAPISGQRALSPVALNAAFPFAAGYGMEIGITVDVVRAGLTVRELELDLVHRATGKTLGGFVHRARQLRDFTRVHASRR